MLDNIFDIRALEVNDKVNDKGAGLNTAFPNVVALSSSPAHVAYRPRYPLWPYEGFFS